MDKRDVLQLHHKRGAEVGAEIAAGIEACLTASPILLFGYILDHDEDCGRVTLSLGGSKYE